MLFNLNKFLRFETRDPFQEKQKRDDVFATDWDRYAYMEYHRLASEEENFSSSNEMNNMDVDRGDQGQNNAGCLSDSDSDNESDSLDWGSENEDEDEKYNELRDRGEGRGKEGDAGLGAHISDWSLNSNSDSNGNSRGSSNQRSKGSSNQSQSKGSSSSSGGGSKSSGGNRRRV